MKQVVTIPWRDSFKQGIVRNAELDDAIPLALLVNSAYRGEVSRQGWTTEADILDGQRIDTSMLKDLIEKKGTVILALQVDSGMIASVQLELRIGPHSEKVGYLGMLTVSPELQGLGIGKFLMGTAEDFMRAEWSVSKVEMSVISCRNSLIEFYVRHGYQRTDRYTEFPYGDSRYGVPKVDNLKMIILEKLL